MMRACQETLYPTWGETEKTNAEHLTYRLSHLQMCTNLWYIWHNSARSEKRTATNRVGLVCVRGPGYRAGAADLRTIKGRTTEEHTPTPAHARLGFALAKLPFLLPTDFGGRYKNI